MLKTIKTTKHMRLDELIKYIFDNDIKDMYFYRKEEKSLFVNRYGEIIPEAPFTKNSLFPVEIEEEITKEMKFDLLIALYKDADVEGGHDTLTHYDKSVKRILDRATNKRCPVKEIHALIDDELQLIYKKEQKK